MDRPILDISPGGLLHVAACFRPLPQNKQECTVSRWFGLLVTASALPGTSRLLRQGGFWPLESTVLCGERDFAGALNPRPSGDLSNTLSYDL